jgi:hypothetical protein
MKTRFRLLLSLLFALAVGVRAQDFAAAPDGAVLTAEQLDRLVGPIALYPDALVALILPAATAPADIVLAARFLKENGDAAAATNLSWDDSVKSLAHYPALVKWMDENLSWTKQLGEAFRDQPAEVMKAIQRMRGRAREAGTLANTAQQQVRFDGELITIVPAQSDAIYVPYYDPAIVYVRQSGFYQDPFLTFGPAFATGPWLAFDCDWRQRTVWTVDRHWTHPGTRDWRRPIFPGQPGYVNDPNRHPWKPVNNFPRQTFANPGRLPGENFSPAPNANPPPTRPDFNDRRGDGRRRDNDPNRPNVATNPVVVPAPAPDINAAQPPGRRFNPSRNRPADRPETSNNPPAIAPVATGPSHFPYGTQPTGPVVAPFSGPLVAPLVGPPAPSPSAPLPTVVFPAAAPATAPTPPPAQNPPEERNRGGRGDSNDQRKQPN